MPAHVSLWLYRLHLSRGRTTPTTGDHRDLATDWKVADNHVDKAEGGSDYSQVNGERLRPSQSMSRYMDGLTDISHILRTLGATASTFRCGAMGRRTTFSHSRSSPSSISTSALQVWARARGLPSSRTRSCSRHLVLGARWSSRIDGM